MDQEGGICVVLARELLALADRPADTGMPQLGNAAG
jgi:hypothetical protein